MIVQTSRKIVRELEPAPPTAIRAGKLKIIRKTDEIHASAGESAAPKAPIGDFLAEIRAHGGIENYYRQTREREYAELSAIFGGLK